MKKLLVVLASLLLILTLAIPAFAHGKSPPNSSASDTYFIAFKSKADQNEIKNLGGELKANKIQKLMPQVKLFHGEFRMSERQKLKI